MLDFLWSKNLDLHLIFNNSAQHGESDPAWDFWSLSSSLELQGDVSLPLQSWYVFFSSMAGTPAVPPERTFPIDTDNVLINTVVLCLF